MIENSAKEPLKYFLSKEFKWPILAKSGRKGADKHFLTIFSFVNLVLL